WAVSRSRSRKARQSSRQVGPTPASPTLRYPIPVHERPGTAIRSDAVQSVNSPSATLTIVERGTTLRTRRQMMRDAIPSDPRDGSLTSMIAAPPARAARASASDRTLTSNLATGRFAAVRSGDLAEFGGLCLLDGFTAPGSREPRRSPLEN